jgi:hypothetical protein
LELALKNGHHAVKRLIEKSLWKRREWIVLIRFRILATRDRESCPARTHTKSNPVDHLACQSKDLRLLPRA